MADEKLLKILKQGSDVWNKWRGENIKIHHPDLNEANLMQADLAGVNLIGANLIQAKLQGANLSGADLRGAKLRRANLRRANLICANLSRDYLLLDGDELIYGAGGSTLSREPITINLRAHKSEDDLTREDSTETPEIFWDLKATDLREAELAEAQMGETNLGDVDLSTASGLEEIKHISASILSIRTIQFFKGKIPVQFLRGCGLSNIEIESAKLVVPGLDSDEVTKITYEIYSLYCEQPIQFYSCFISYNSKDQKFAQRLHDDLQNRGVRCWFAPEDLKIGDEFRRTIGQQIRIRDKLLIILSKNSVASEWVGDEVEKALVEEKEAKALKLFPIRLDGAVLKSKDDWAEKIRFRRHIGDFSGWKDEGKYKKAFERLLKDLKTH